MKILLLKLLQWLRETLTGKTCTILPDESLPPPVDTPVLPPKPSLVPSEPPKYDWSTPDKARHSVRLICDEEGLDWKMKNELDLTVQAESGYDPKAVGKPNYDGSQDFGIAQFNNLRWIGPGLPFPSEEFVLNNPEKCIRVMAKEFLRGHQSWWYGWQKLFKK